MSNPYIDEMEKQAGVRDALARGMEAVHLGALNMPVSELRIRNPMYRKVATPVAAPEAVVASKVEKPGILGSTFNATSRTVKGGFARPLNYVKNLAGTNVNATILHHAEVLGKFSGDAEKHEFEKQLNGMSDEEKLRFTQDNLGPLAVKEVHKSMNSRAFTRATTAVGAAGLAAKAIQDRQQDNQY